MRFACSCWRPSFTSSRGTRSWTGSIWWPSLFGVLFSISSLVEYEVLSSYAERERLRAQEVQFLKLSAQHQGELEGLYAQILEMQHDFKHQIQVVERMLEQGECAESRQYLEQFRAHQPRAAALTGNLAVDALLTAKRSILQEKGIAFSFQAYPLQGCPLDDVELCTVLGNLLDNAMEGVDRLRPEQKKEVHLEFQQALNLFFIVCENAANPDALKMQGDRFLSSKEGTESTAWGSRACGASWSARAARWTSAWRETRSRRGFSSRSGRRRIAAKTEKKKRRGIVP